MACGARRAVHRAGTRHKAVAQAQGARRTLRAADREGAAQAHGARRKARCAGGASMQHDDTARDAAAPTPRPAALAARHPGRTLGLLALALAGWLGLAWLAFDMGHPLARLAMPPSAHWSGANLLAVGAMWAVMMAAMMLPSALPMVLTFVAPLGARRAARRGAAPSSPPTSPRGSPSAPPRRRCSGPCRRSAGSTRWPPAPRRRSPRRSSSSPASTSSLPLKQRLPRRSCRSPAGVPRSARWRPGAAWRAWRMGARPRPVLPRLLLGADGAALRRRRR